MGGSWLGTGATNQEDNHSYFPTSSYFEIDSTIDLIFEEILTAATLSKKGLLGLQRGRLKASRHANSSSANQPFPWVIFSTNEELYE